MFRNSFWYPRNAKIGILLLALLILIVLRQTELLGLMDATQLIFGWLPIQLAVDMAITIGGAAVLYAMYLIAPAPPERFVPSERGER